MGSKFKKIGKIIKGLIILSAFLFVFLPFLPAKGQEENTNQTEQTKTDANVKEIPISVRIPGITKECKTEEYKGRYCVSDFGNYISQFYIWFARAAGIFAAVMIVFAGFQWIFAQGNASKIESAKSTMNGALIGLVLTIGAYLLLNTINPDLVHFNLLRLTNISKTTLSGLYCKDVPGIEKLNIPDSPNFACGRKYDIPKADAEKAGYSQNFCCGTYCPKNEKGVSQLCVFDPTINDLDKCSQKCADAKTVCQKESKDKCGEVDKVFEAQNITEKTPNGKEFELVCRKDYRTARFDACDWFFKFPNDPCSKESLENFAGKGRNNEGWSRVNCNYSGINGDLDTPCWNKIKPNSAEGNQRCTDDKRGGMGNDAVCCARNEKQYINCREDGHDDEVEVNCADYDSLPGNYEDYDQSTCNSRCWLELDLISFWPEGK